MAASFNFQLLENKKSLQNASFDFSVGAARFELATSWSQTRRDDRTTLRPELLFKDANVRKFMVDAILFSNKWLRFDFQGGVFFLQLRCCFRD